MATRDLEEQERLLQGMFRMLRSGRTTDAIALSARSGAAWLGASIEGAGCGLLPFTVPSPVEAPHPDTVELADDEVLAADVLAGQGAEVAAACGTHPTARREAWRRACVAVEQAVQRHAGGPSPQAGLASTEAAVYGMLAGNVHNVLPMCNGWVDRVWAHARCFLQVLPEELLEDHREKDATGRKRGLEVLRLFGLRGLPVAPSLHMSSQEAARSFLVCS
jgi:hypothetical protein